MTTYSVTKNKTATLAASTADIVNLTQFWDNVEVSNQGSSPIYMTQTGTAPTVAGDNSEIIEAGVTKLFKATRRGSSTVNGTDNHIIGLISAGTPQYTVSGVAASLSGN